MNRQPDGERAGDRPRIQMFRSLSSCHPTSKHGAVPSSSDTMYPSIDIARAVAILANDDIHPVRQLELQWIMWDVWVDWFGRTGEPLFEEEFTVGTRSPIDIHLPGVRREFRIYAAGPITCPMEPSQALPFGVMAFLYREVLSHRGRWDVGRNAELRERWIRFEGRSIPWYVVAAEIPVGQ